MSEESKILDKMINKLESVGEVTISNDVEDLFIQSVDYKEGYAYVSSTNIEFQDSSEAIQWAIEEMNGIDNIKTFS